jgi:uncharacterized CHY-type Zn-finger protein
MSFSNIFNNNLVQTPVGNAYQFSSQSEFVKNMKVPSFSPICIFCSCRESISLNNEGSFRQCKKCNKQFKATFGKSCAKP